MSIFHGIVAEEKDGERAVEGRRHRKLWVSTLLESVGTTYH